jgi:hypothetical protein
MTIGYEIPKAQSAPPRVAPLEGSRKCPYCAPDRRAPADVTLLANELDLLRHFVGMWERWT